MVGRPRLLVVCALAGLVSAAWIAINAEKPVNTDDTFFVYWARVIAPRPGDVPIRNIDWDRFEEPLVMQTQHYTPGWSLLLAATRDWTRERPARLHALVWPFATLWLIAIVLLAESCGAPPWLTLLVCVTSPVFLVPTAGLLADVPAAGLALLGLALWRLAPGWGGRIAAAGLLALAGQMKQTVLVLYPLLVLGDSGRLTRSGRDWALAAASLVLGGAYPDVPPHSLERTTILGHVAWILQTTWNPALVWSKLSYLGTSLAALLLVPPAYAVALLARRGTTSREKLGAVAVGVVAIILMSAAGCWRKSLMGGVSLVAIPGRLGTLWFEAALAGFLAWAIVALRPRADGASRWLWAWLGLVCAGSVAGTFFEAARHLIPALPPLAMLWLLDLRRTCGERAVRWAVGVTAAGNLWLALSLARSDAVFASFGPEAAARGAAWAATERLPLVTTGSWGLRYAVDRFGGRILDRPTDPLATGAVMLCPSLTDHRVLPAALRRRARSLATLVCPASRGWPGLLPARTIPPPETGGAFHGGQVWFPYGFSRAAYETVTVLRIAPLALAPRPAHSSR